RIAWPAGKAARPRARPTARHVPATVHKHHSGAMTQAKSLYVFARVIDYLGVGLFVGGCVFVAILWPAGAGSRRTRRLLGVGWFLGLAGTVAALVFQTMW